MNNPGTSSKLIEIFNVHMVFQRRFSKPVHALRSLSLTVEKGSIVGLLGPNGCGKTTAISCLLGLLHPQIGSLSLWGIPIHDIPKIDRDHFYGVLLEDTRLPPYLTVKEAIKYSCKLRGYKASQTTLEMNRVQELTDIGELGKRKIRVLSKGQARRVGLAIALIGDPKLLILDEPAAGLDVTAREGFNNLIQTLRNGERTIIIASHLLSDIEATASHIAIMKDGQCIHYQDTETMFDNLRQNNTGKSIFLDHRFASTLTELSISYENSKYPGLLKLLINEPEYEVILRLAQHKIVPDRIESEENLVSMYLNYLNGRNQS